MSGLLALVVFRAKLLAFMLVVALVLGEKLSALSRMDHMAQRYHRFAILLGTRLNRPSRSIATLVYRGIIAIVLLEIPVLILAFFLSRNDMLIELLGIVVMVALLGRGFQSHRLMRCLQQAKTGTLALEVDHTLYADTHGVLRHTIARSAERFSIHVIGGGFWFVLGGLPCTLAYLAIAVAAQHYHADAYRAFGWATGHLFRIVHTIPQFFSNLLLLCAGFLIPKTHPLTAVRHIRCNHREGLSIVAALLDIALEAPTKTGSPSSAEGWIGNGTAQLTVVHFTRWLALLVVASVLLWLGLLTFTII